MQTKNQRNTIAIRRPRLEYVDLLKGLSILGIMFVHFEDGCIPQWLNAWIGNFMITAFYFVAGWILAQKEPITNQKLGRKLLRSLGIPYLTFSAFILLFDLIWYLFGLSDFSVILHDSYKFITLRGIGTLWFLPALFGGELIFNFLRNDWRRILIALLITIVLLYGYSVWVENLRNVSLLHQAIDAPMRTVSNILRAWPVVAAGYASAVLFEKIKDWSRYSLLIIAGVIIALSLYFSSFCRIDLSVFGYFVSPILGPLGLLLLCYGIGRCQFLSFWGRNSLIVMATHYSILLVICQQIDQSLFHRPSFTGVPTILFFAASMLVEYPIIWLVNHKLSFLLGRKRN